MTLLSERQQTARALARAIDDMGAAWVTSALPLDDQVRALRLQILDSDRNRVVQAIRDLGFEPVLCGVLPRIHPTGVLAACAYEISLPQARQPVIDDRIQGELATKKKPHEMDLIAQEWFASRLKKK
jgi:hypothetical protein